MKSKNKDKRFKKGTILRSTLKETDFWPGTGVVVVSTRLMKKYEYFRGICISGHDNAGINADGVKDNFLKSGCPENPGEWWEPVDPLELFKPHVKTKTAASRDWKVGDVFIDRIGEPRLAWMIIKLYHDERRYNTVLLTASSPVLGYQVGDKSLWDGSSYLEGVELLDISSLTKQEDKPEPGPENTDGFTYDIYSVIKLNKPFSDAYRVKALTVDDRNLVDQSILGLGIHEVVVGCEIEVCYNGITLDTINSWHWSNYIARGEHPNKPDIPELSYYEYLVLLMLFKIDADDEYSGECISTKLFNTIMLAGLRVMGLISVRYTDGSHIWYSLEHDKAKMAMKYYTESKDCGGNQ